MENLLVLSTSIVSSLGGIHCVGNHGGKIQLAVINHCSVNTLDHFATIGWINVFAIKTKHKCNTVLSSDTADDRLHFLIRLVVNASFTIEKIGFGLTGFSLPALG